MRGIFRFNHFRSQRTKKLRGVLRKAKRAANDPAAYERELDSTDWFNACHQHLDWHGLGNAGPEVRKIFLKGYADLFRHFAMQANKLEKPYQLWIFLDVKDAGNDAVYLHTPNPHSDFPYSLKGALWNSRELAAIFAEWLPEFKLLAGSLGDSRFIYAEDFGVPMNQS